jgi:hypothetical protein
VSTRLCHARMCYGLVPMPATPRGKSSPQARSRKPAQHGQVDFETVRETGLALPEVEASTAYGAFALKLRGKLLACTAINKAAEPNSLMVRLAFEHRDRLIKEQPEVFYLKDHYAPYPCVLVRLPKVGRGALRDLLGDAWRFVMESTPHRAPKRGKRAKPTGR